MMSPSTPFSNVVHGPAATVETDVLADLARWIRDRRTQGCVRVLLAQRVTEVTHHTVEDWEVTHLDDAAALAQVIYSTGVREAQAVRSAFAYCVFALRGDRGEPSGRFLFRIDARQGWGDLAPAGVTDERTEIIRLLMGHADVSARLSLGHSRGILDQYERLIEQGNTQQTRLLDQAQKRIAELEAREQEGLELRNKLESFAHQREVELTRVRERNETLRFGIKQLGTAAPVVLAAFGLGDLPGKLDAPAPAAGSASPAPRSPAPAAERETAPTSGSPAPAAQEEAAPGPVAQEDAAPASVENLVARFFNSLSDKQALTFGAILRPDQRMILAQLHQLAQAAQADEEAAASAIPAGAVPAPSAEGALVATGEREEAAGTQEPAAADEAAADDASIPTKPPTREGTPQ
jgi:hypothetical protein